MHQEKLQGFEALTLDTFFNKLSIEVTIKSNCNRRKRLEIYQIFRCYLVQNGIEFVEEKISGVSSLSMEIWLLSDFKEHFPVICPSNNSVRISIVWASDSSIHAIDIWYHRGIGFFRESEFRAYTTSVFVTSGKYFPGKVISSSMQLQDTCNFLKDNISKKRLKQQKRRGRINKNRN